MTPLSQEPLVSTIGERCRVCYQCVRECPAKAIRIADHQAQVRVGLQGRNDLLSQVIHDIQERSIRPGLVGNERAAQFEKNKLLHAPILSHSREEAV